MNCEKRNNYSINLTLFAKGRCYAPNREYTLDIELCATSESKAIEQAKKIIVEQNGIEKEEIVNFVVNEVLKNGKEKRNYYEKRESFYKALN